MDIIKKILGILMVLPAFTKLFQRASQTGKIDPQEALSALSSISPGTKKCADVALNAVNNGGNVVDVASALQNVGEVELLGTKVNTKTMVQDLEKAGGACSILANMLKKIPNQPVQDTVNMGEVFSDVSNWKDLMRNS